jgi:acetyl esterase/lipase
MIAPWTLRLPHLMIGVLTTLLLLGACSRSQTNADRNRASQPTDDLAIAHSIPYGPDTRNNLDIYAPRAPGPPRPTIIFFYGGGYDSGAKADFAWVGAALARRGYVVVVPDFRLYPKVLWPKFLEDCAAAVRWAHDHAATYGGNPSALVLMGHSSGAYNAVSLAVDRRWLAEVAMDPRRDLRAVIGLSGPYDDLPTTNTKLQTIFGANWRDTQPINHADGRSPPLMLITGDRDDIVDPPESDKMANKVRANGGTAVLVHYPLLGHGGTLEAFLPPRGKKSQVLNDVASFIRAQIAVARH